MLSALTLIPFAVSLYFGDFNISYRYASVIAVLVVFGLSTTKLEEPSHVQINEALSVIALIFVIAALLMTYPLMGAGLTFSDALFEAISGVTTTGLTTVTDVENTPKTFLFARAWMQWYGGLGIVILSVALFMKHSIATRRLTEPLSNETFVSTSRTYARHMLVVYICITVFALLVIWLLTKEFFVSLTHVLTAVSTGGFSTFNNSLSGIPSDTVKATLMLFTICGALPLPLFYIAWKNGFKQFFQDIEFFGLLLMIVIISVLLMVFLKDYFAADWQQTIFHGAMVGISAQTGTGFSTLNMETQASHIKLLMIISMVIGGCTASTAGGIKILRLLIFARLLQLIVQRTTLPPHAVTAQKLGGKNLDNDELQRALLLIILFAVVILVSWLCFLFYGYKSIDALFEVVSAVGTVGLTTGITQSDMPALLKSVLAIDMLLGRLEIIAFIVLLYPRTWLGQRGS